MTSGRAERYYALLAFGADPTGRAPSDYAFSAAASTMSRGDLPLFLPLPPGVFRVSFPLDFFPAGTTLAGADPYACTITVDPEDFGNFSFEYIINASNCPGLTVRDITIDGRKRDGTNPANQCGLVMAGRDTTLERVHLRDPNYFGLWLQSQAVNVTVERCVSSLGGNNDSIGGGGGSNILIRRHRWKADTVGNLFDNVGGSGVVLDECVSETDGVSGGIYFEGMVNSGIRRSTIPGASLQSDSGYDPSTITNPLGCFLEDNDSTGSLMLLYAGASSTPRNPGGHNSVRGNRVTEPAVMGIFVDGGAVPQDSSGGDLVVANAVFDANASGAAEYNSGNSISPVCGIILNPAWRVICTDNVVVDSRSAPLQAYSIVLGGNSGSAKDCVVARNFCRGSSGSGDLGVGDIATDNSTDCRIEDNNTELGVASYGNTCLLRRNGPAPAIAAPSVPAASTSITNDTGADVDVYIAGGTDVSVSIGSADTGLAGGSFYLPFGVAINLGAYTAAPTWTWVPR